MRHTCSLYIIGLLAGFTLLFGCDAPAPVSAPTVRTYRPSTETAVRTAARSVADATAPTATGFDLDYLMGKFDPAAHPDFIEIPARYADRAGRYLRKDALDAFLAMREAAAKDSVELKIVSAARNFANQKSIWEAKWTGERLVEEGENLAVTTPDPIARARRILRWSSMPGSSRHHWGTDIDLNNLNNAYFEGGKGLREYQWLTANAATFGFCQPYSPKGGSGQRAFGYEEEKWHWSYLPVALPLTELAESQLRNELITGFKGAETAGEIDVKGKYVLGISGVCR